MCEFIDQVVEVSLHLFWQHIDGIHKALHYALQWYTCSAVVLEVPVAHVT